MASILRLTWWRCINSDDYTAIDATWTAIGRFGSKVSITQIGGGNGDGHMLGGPQEVAKFLASLNAESEAMTGMNLKELMSQFADFLKSFRTQAEVRPAPEGTSAKNVPSE